MYVVSKGEQKSTVLKRKVLDSLLRDSFSSLVFSLLSTIPPQDNHFITRSPGLFSFLLIYNGTLIAGVILCFDCDLRLVTFAHKSMYGVVKGKEVKCTSHKIIDLSRYIFFFNLRMIFFYLDKPVNLLWMHTLIFRKMTETRSVDLAFC